MPNPQTILSKLEQIESEMRRTGLWQKEPLQPEQYNFRAAFAMDIMAFSQWLQFIFIPRVKEAAQTKQFPKSSRVAAQAVREFDGMDEATELVRLLSEFDALFS